MSCAWRLWNASLRRSSRHREASRTSEAKPGRASDGKPTSPSRPFAIQPAATIGRRRRPWTRLQPVHERSHDSLRIRKRCQTLSPASIRARRRTRSLIRNPNSSSRTTAGRTAPMHPRSFARSSTPTVPTMLNPAAVAARLAAPSSRTTSAFDFSSPSAMVSASPLPRFGTNEPASDTARIVAQDNRRMFGSAICRLRPSANSAATASATCTSPNSVGSMSNCPIWCRYCSGDVLQKTSSTIQVSLKLLI